MAHTEQEQEEMKKFADWLSWRMMDVDSFAEDMRHDRPPYASARFDKALKQLKEFRDSFAEMCDYYHRRADGLDY